MARPSLRHQLLISGSLLALCAGVFGVAIHSTFAGSLPSSLSPNISIKAAIYQGVVAIAPTTTTVLELGNAGRDIAGSSDLYLRPNGLAEAQGAHIVASGTVSDLYVASLCLYGTGSEVCQSGVPSGGSDTFWRSVVQSGTFEHLMTNAANQGVQIGSQTSPVLGKALEINTNAVAPAITLTGDMMTGSLDDGDYSTIGSGSVAVSGRLQITNSIVAQDTLRVGYHLNTDNYAIVWSQLYQGRFTGLDADTFDGTTSVLFSNVAKKDFFWKDIIASPTQQYQVLCVHSESPSLCSNTSGALSGKICTTNAECGSGSCVRLCQTENATCAAGTSVTNSHTIAASNCAIVTGDGGCNDYCATNPRVVVCDGGIPPPSTSCPSGSIGSRVYSTSGTFVSCGILGSNANITCNCKNRDHTDTKHQETTE
jgi:hypothetical protein